VQRHRLKHLPAALVHAREIKKYVASDSIADKLKALEAIVLKVLWTTEKEKSWTATLGASRELRGILDLCIRLKEVAELEQDLAKLEAVVEERLAGEEARRQFSIVRGGP
jgi:hypothetical protein